ncbi:MAG: Ig-like domain-containing protein, partial [Planctomycetota bacterium]
GAVDLQHSAVDLGDNTFAFAVPGGFHRIDGEQYGSSLSLVPPSGRQWWPLFEKARYVENRPESLPVEQHPYRRTIPLPSDGGERYYAFARAAMAAGKQIGHFSRGWEIDYEAGSPGQHAHSLISAYRASDGSPRFLLRNPYGTHYEIASGPLDPLQGFRDLSYAELVELFNPPTITGGENTVHDPVALPQDVTVAAGESLLIHLRGYDIDGRPCTTRIVDAPSRGNIDAAGTWVRYTPGGSTAGTERLRFKLHNGVRSGSTATVTITITGDTPSEPDPRRRLRSDIAPAAAAAGIEAAVDGDTPQALPSSTTGLLIEETHRIRFHDQGGDG